MFRIIGFLVGVVLTLVFLTAVVDRPTRDRVGLLAVELTGPVLDTIDRIFPETPGPADLELKDPGQTLIDQTALEPTVPELPVQPRATAAASAVDEDVTMEEPLPLPVFQDTIVWQPLWTAFHSELSARGFASRLEHLTGREYRVRRASPWSYQVEVAYKDEEQRDALIEEIQQRTGLVLQAQNQ